MSSPSVNYGESSIVDAPAELIGSDKRLRWFELCLVLLTACVPAFVNSLEFYLHGRDILPLIQRSNWDTRILVEITGLMLLGYVLLRRKRSFRDIGLRWSMRDLGIGVLVTIAAYVAYVIGYYLIHFALHPWFSSTQQGQTAHDLYAHPSAMSIFLVLLNPFFEELIVRAYLMTEIAELTRSWVLAAAVSTIVQASYHLYYGWMGMLSLSFQFLIFSIYYAKARKALPVIVAHGIFDLVALIRLR
jgi:membrane protease YdiL (CAAX protease family)